jgi:hypothetical protein
LRSVASGNAEDRARHPEGVTMPRPGPATQAKRYRERSRQERQQEKQEKRSQRKKQKTERERMVEEGVDPDLAGIVPGPQPPQEGK